MRVGTLKTGTVTRLQERGDEFYIMFVIRRPRGSQTCKGRGDELLGQTPKRGRALKFLANLDDYKLSFLQICTLLSLLKTIYDFRLEILATLIDDGEVSSFAT